MAKVLKARERIELKKRTTAPRTPSSDTVVFYANSDGNLSKKDSTGTVTVVGDGDGGGSSPDIVVKGSNQLLSSGAGLDDDDLIVTCSEAGTYRITGNIRSDGAAVALWRLLASGVTIVRITGSVMNSGGSYMIADKDPTGDDYIAGIGGDSNHDTNSSFVDQSFFDVIVTVTGTGTLTVNYYYDPEGSAPTIQAGSTLISSLIS